MKSGGVYICLNQSQRRNKETDQAYLISSEGVMARGGVQLE